MNNQKTQLLLRIFSDGLLAYFKFSRIELFRDTVAFCFVFYGMSHVFIITCRFPVYLSIHIYICNNTYLYNIGVCVYIYLLYNRIPKR